MVGAEGESLDSARSEDLIPPTVNEVHREGQDDAKRLDTETRLATARR